MTDYITNIQEFQNSKRSERYKRLRVSARIAHEVTHHSVGSCMSAMTGSFVDVVYNKSTGRSSFNGLITCGSVWDCPVCSAKISFKRRDELNLALDNWHDAGGHVVMVTYTVRHNKGDKLEDLVKVLNGGVRFVKSGAPYKRKKELYKIVGSVTATEVLYNSVNGWHYHKHQVLFIDNKLSDQEINELENWLYDRYNGYLLRNGYSSERKIGVFISQELKYQEGGYNLADYCTKWGLGEEMTGADFKESDKGLNPFELLDDEKYKYQWIEYSKAMKGKRRLVWSNNMRSILGLNDELSDEEIAEAQEAIDENTEIRCKLVKKSWRYVVKNNLRAELLKMSEVGGDEFKSWYFRNVLGPLYKSIPPGSQ